MFRTTALINGSHAKTHGMIDISLDEDSSDDDLVGMYPIHISQVVQTVFNSVIHTIDTIDHESMKYTVVVVNKATSHLELSRQSRVGIIVDVMYQLIDRRVTSTYKQDRLFAELDTIEMLRFIQLVGEERPARAIDPYRTRAATTTSCFGWFWDIFQREKI
jgi:hypothetical protein